jgi:DNA adenine methylase
VLRKALVPEPESADGRIAGVKRGAARTAHELPSSPAAAPFLKWAGGKRQLLPQLRRFYPDRFDAYCEPFLGSGAVFFDLQAAGVTGARPVWLVDRNVDLIGCYAAIRDDVEDVIAHLRRLERAHHRRGARHYYEIRDGRFNRARASPAGAGLPGPVSHRAERAAQLIYLNRTCFNGLFRQNSRGEFNVPVGHYSNPRICDESNLRRVSAALRADGVALEQADFDRALAVARRGTFVYLDPPYEPVSATAQFRSYTANGFSARDQIVLQRVVITLAERGCHVVLSNSVAPGIAELYEHNRDARRAGLAAHRVPARRAINCNGSARGAVEEFIVSNVTPREPVQ